MDASAPEQTLQPLPAAFTEQLAARFGTQCTTNKATCTHHGQDESSYPAMPPQMVVFAQSVDDVVFVAKLCHQHRVPLIPHGAGSSLEGHLLAIKGGISLDLTGLDKVLTVYDQDLQATVQAGVTRKQLNEALRYSGLFFPIDPGADASLGGMAATRASGTNAVRYGTMMDNVVALKVVTADGRLIQTSHRARKSSAGYDLTRLFVGSEGTLGIIVEVTVKLYPRPEATSAAICNFPDTHAAVQSVIEIMQMDIPVARVEFMDVHAVRATNQYSHLDLRESPLLLFEFIGSPSAVREQAEAVQAITHEHGGRDFVWAEKPEERSRLWTARHQAYFAGLQLRPGCRSSTTDVCVPISRLADAVMETSRDLDAASFPYTILGHVGDGNFHVMMLLDPDNPKEWEESEQLNQRLVERAIAMDGTCTGEHGVGLHKRAFLVIEHGNDALDVMRTMKDALDPRHILNPDKILPERN